MGALIAAHVGAENHLIRHLVQRRALQQRGSSLVTTISPADLRLPEQVMGAIVAPTKRLSEDCRRVLTLASFLGERFSLQTLDAVSGVSEDVLLNLLEEGMHERLLLSEGQTFQVAHPLIRHAFYHEPSAARRQRIHQQIAQTLQRLYADSPNAHILEIAHHLVRAGPVAAADTVVAYARQAGAQALTVFAWGEAARYYEAALSAAESAARLTSLDRAELHYTPSTPSVAREVAAAAQVALESIWILRHGDAEKREIRIRQVGESGTG